MEGLSDSWWKAKKVPPTNVSVVVGQGEEELICRYRGELKKRKFMHASRRETTQREDISSSTIDE
jgi:hypothetical protein